MPLFSYDAGTGSDYARAFALHRLVPESQQLFFYSPDDDCTNFISQCVWASYGGWVPGFDDTVTAENARRIKQDIRQITGVWYGSRNHIGSPAWCRVVEFYRLVTGTKSAGPAARLVAEGTFADVPASAVRQGDIIQLVVTAYTPDRFGHGVYVTCAAPDWDNVLICCHSYDRLDSPMGEFAAQPAAYPRLRVLRFTPAFFPSESIPARLPAR